MKTDTIIIEITQCWQCRNWYQSAAPPYPLKEYRCMKTGKVVDLYGGIPEWCPLEDKKTDQEKLREDRTIK